MKIALISIDGNGVYNLKNMSFLSKLGNNGYNKLMKTTFPSLTDSVHSSLMTGMYPKHHGIVENGYYDRINGEKVNFYEEDVVLNPHKHIRSKTLVDYLRETDLKTASVSAYMMPPYSGTDMRIFPPFYKEDLFHEYGKDLEKDKWVVESSKYIAKSFDPDVMFIHFCSIDAVGHETGPDSEESLETVKELDKKIEELYKYLKQYNYNFIFLSDHGQKPVDTILNPELLLENRDIEVERISPGGGTHIFLRKNQERYEMKKMQAIDILRSTKGVRNVYKREELPYLDSPNSGDIIASSKTGYWFHNFFDSIKSPSDNPERHVEGMHGSDTNRVMEVPLIINGGEINYSFVEDLESKRPRDYPLDESLPSVFDISPTILDLLNIDVPSNLVGTPLLKT